MKKLSPVALGLAIKNAREQSKFLGSDLAKQVGMTQSTLSRTENGTRPVELAEAELIANATGTTLTELIKVARQLESSSYVQQREKAVAEFRRSLIEVKDAARLVIEDLHKATT